MTFLRPVLLIVLSVVGGYLGRYAGSQYVLIPAIQKVIGDNRTILGASQLGFVCIGVLIGVFGYSRASAYLGDLVENLRGMPANDKIALCVGAVVGFLLTFLIFPMFNQIQDPILRLVMTVGLAFVMVFLSVQGSMSMREELRKLLPPYGSANSDERDQLRQSKILDTNIIIDGRIADICRAGFVEGTLYVPGFVLDELQSIADSSDALRRARGRRGLDILNQMQKEFKLIVRSYDHLINKDHGEPVDNRLVRLSKAVGATIITNDYNLNKVAELQGVTVLNVNELANALKPVVLPGEELNVLVIKEGKQPGQGIAYLDDGTMVVVEGGRSRLGETVEAVVTSVVQNVQGKMIFSTLREYADQEQDNMDRNMRSYRPPVRRTPPVPRA